MQVSQTRSFRCVSKRAFSRSAEEKVRVVFVIGFAFRPTAALFFHVQPLTSTFRSAAVGNLPDSVRLSGCQYKSVEVRAGHISEVALIAIARPTVAASLERSN